MLAEPKEARNYSYEEYLREFSDKGDSSKEMPNTPEEEAKILADQTLMVFMEALKPMKVGRTNPSSAVQK